MNDTKNENTKSLCRYLEKLLKAKEWRKADELTTKLMLQVAGREKRGYLDSTDIDSFPCEHLLTIDQLWVYYSDSKFGFSGQKKLWLACGGEIDKYNYEIFEKFAAKVGWYRYYNPQKKDSPTYTEFMNDTKNIQNFLPASLPLDHWVHRYGETSMYSGMPWRDDEMAPMLEFGMDLGVYLFSRIEICEA